MSSKLGERACFLLTRSYMPQIENDVRKLSNSSAIVNLKVEAG